MSLPIPYTVATWNGDIRRRLTALDAVLEHLHVEVAIRYLEGTVRIWCVWLRRWLVSRMPGRKWKCATSDPHSKEYGYIYELGVYREGDTLASILPAQWPLFIVVAAQDRHDRSRSS